jgi:hypothetical protein
MQRDSFASTSAPGEPLMMPAPRHSVRPLSASLVLLALAAAGCSSGERSADATKEGSAPPRSTATAPEKPDLCVLMPLADVAATLQATGVGTVNQYKSGAGGMCSYQYVPKPGDFQVKLLIDFTRARSADEAKQSLEMQRQEFARRGSPVSDVPDLGDAAFVSESIYTEGLKVQSGAWIGQINLTAGERPPATLRPAVLALGKQVLQRLPR